MKARQGRSAYSFFDMTVALSVLLTVLVIAAQAAVWSLSERVRTEARQEAIETVANVMESARGVSWDGLDAWAREQKPPEALASRLDKARLVVRVEAEPARPACKRVSAELTWTGADGKAASPVRLTAVFSPRSAEAKGGQP